MAVDRTQVVHTAVALLRSEGEQALGVNRIARELGIKPPSMYNHVDGNPDLRRAVAEHGWSSLSSLLSHISGPFRVHGIAAAVRAFARENPALYKLMHSEPVQDTAMPWLAEALADRGVYDLAATQALWAAIHGLSSLEASWEGSDRALERLLQALVPMPSDVSEEIVDAFRESTAELGDDWAFY